jgi:hypothetical protein
MENQQSPSVVIVRSQCQVPRMKSGMTASTAPAATIAGTSGSGASASIGTKISCSGTT